MNNASANKLKLNTVNASIHNITLPITSTFDQSKSSLKIPFVKVEN